MNALESRFSAKGRLLDLPSFDTLPSVHEAVPFSGALTLWDVDRVGRRPPALVGEYDPGYKIQSAVFRGDQLLVLGEDRIEVLTPGFRQKTIEDPWLVGGHTIYCDRRGFAYATSAPANAVLKIDVDAGKVVERIRLPDCYGGGYFLSESDDLRLHFVPTDLQPTHVNSAVPCAEGLLVTLCIPGVVGVIGSTGQFREIVRGYRGCHGGRIDNASGLLYFTDSPAGIVWFAEYETGQIASRIKIDSVWVHDADQIGENLFAVSLSDHNRIDVVDRTGSEIVRSIDCHPFGASAIFVKAAELPDAWRPKRRTIPRGASALNSPKVSAGRELLSDSLNPVAWMRFEAVPASISPSLHIGCESVQYEYLAEGLTVTLLPGDYVFAAHMVCKVGEASVGLLDETEAWIVQLTFDASNTVRSTRFSIHVLSSVTILVTGHNSRRACPVDAEIKSLSLKCLTTGLENASSDAVVVVPRTVVHRRAEVEHLQTEINKRDALLASAQKGLAELQDEINKRDGLLRKANGLHKQTHDHLQSEVNNRDALLKEAHKGLERLQGEVNKRDDLLKSAYQTLEHLQAEISSRDGLLKKADGQHKKTLNQLQSEINLRDAMLKVGQRDLERLQAEINTRDTLLKKTESLSKEIHDQLQGEINKRDALLKASHEGHERMQAEISARDALLKNIESLSKKTHDQLQSEINTRDAMLKAGQGELERLQAEINARDALLKKTESLGRKTHDQLQSEINKRDALLKAGHGKLERLQAEINARDALLKKTESLSRKIHDQLQSEINTRDALLKAGDGKLERLQGEINARDALLKKIESLSKKTHDQLQSEINTRDAMLKAGQVEIQRLQAEINMRDQLLKETHDHLQAEVNTRDQMLDELQRQLNERL